MNEEKNSTFSIKEKPTFSITYTPSGKARVMLTVSDAELVE